MKYITVFMLIIGLTTSSIANDKTIPINNCPTCQFTDINLGTTEIDNIPSRGNTSDSGSDSSGNTVVAEEQLFYKATVGTWTIIGHPGNANLNPACVIIRKWEDGSEFNLIRDIKDGELYIRIDNMAWNIGDPLGEYGRTPGTNPIRMNVKLPNSINSNNVVWNLVAKNAITIRHLNVRNFIADFVAGSKIYFIMPGTIQNADFDLTNSSEAVEHMIRCYSIKASPGQKT